MASDLVSAAYLIAVAFLWGATNPLIKRGSVGVERVEKENAFLQFFGEIKFLVLNWKYVIPFLLNQSGSILYFFALQRSDISLAVPVTNALAFVFTWVVGQALGEEVVDKRTVVGMFLIICGTSLCFIDKVWFGEEVDLIV